ncbi:MAG TPA: potassium channel family protein [Micromonosporaceae bacterium]|nr:potassium channel family protein [Micromonosporaceae bacterium]
MIHLPGGAVQDPLRAIGRRVLAAVGLIVLVAFAVYLDRDGYRDVNGDGITLLDSFYYAVVSLSTTGYGDIAPASQPARFLNIVLITPARILFLIILVGTTLQVLTEQYRTNARLMRWRRTVKDHVIVCGYGTKGRSAVKALLENGLDRSQVVVVEPNPAAARQAAADGLVCVEGSATRSSVLTEAHVKKAKTVIIATNTDESAVLITLTTRQLTSGQVRIVAATREAENVPLLKQSGAHHVIVSSATAGRLMGLSTSAPPLIDVVEDLLTPGAGMALAMRSATRDEVGASPRDLSNVVIALVRRGQVLSLGQPEAQTIQTGDMVVYVRDDEPAVEPAETQS